jgi:small-conductance mechanosensitive channel
VIRGISILGILTNVIGFVFREIKYSWAIDSYIVRKFLPIVRFTVTASVWIITLLYIFEGLDINTGNLLAWAGIGGVILALAAKDIMTNLFGSLSILLSKTFDIGDEIRLAGPKGTIYEGIVEEITLNHTRIQSSTGEVVYIPNRSVYTEVVENLTRRRFYTYTYLIPFKKWNDNTSDIVSQMRIIEGKISEYDPIEIEWKAENPNAWDYMYKITVSLPEKDRDIDREIREFLVTYIFQAR